MKPMHCHAPITVKTIRILVLVTVVIMCVVKRTITFCLGCCTVLVVCCGLTVTVIAGIAYGYNYSLAEFLTLSKTDVTVYMRRGQFYDNPDLVQGGNRRMGGEDDVFSPNIPSDYEEPVSSNNDAQPVADTWLKEQDANEYAKKLIKYSGSNKIGIEDTVPKQKQIQQTSIFTLPPTRRLSKIPFMIPTTVWRSDNTEIVMRKFLPLHDITDELKKKQDNDDFYELNTNSHSTQSSNLEYNERQTAPIQPDVKIRFEDFPERKLMPIVTEDRPNKRIDDDIEDEADEDNIIYKPV